jgi:hypothetical protein
VTYVQTTGAPDVVVSPTGVVTTIGQLTAGPYSVTGTQSDPTGNQGTFKLTLTVGALVQRTPTAATVTTSDSASFNQQLDVGANLGALTYVQTSGAPNVVVSSLGLVTTSGTLAVGTDRVAGTVSDATGDKGMFTFYPDRPRHASPATSGAESHARSRDTSSPAERSPSTIDGAHFYGQPHVTSHPGTDRHRHTRPPVHALSRTRHVARPLAKRRLHLYDHRARRRHLPGEATTSRK